MEKCEILCTEPMDSFLNYITDAGGVANLRIRIIKDVYLNFKNS